MNENCYIPYTGPQSLVENPMVQNFLALRKVNACNVPTVVKRMTPFCS